MRKINYKLKIAIIGKDHLGNEIILNYLRTIAIDKRKESPDSLIFQIIHKFIPINIHIKLYENMNAMLSESESLNGYDFLFFVII
jgi:hypothetical protein